MSVLSITVSGPFAFVDHFPLADYITIMAPLCAQHKAGIAGIDSGNEFTLEGNSCNHPASSNGKNATQYELQIELGQPGLGNWGTEPTLDCKINKSSLDATYWRFWLTLPRPDVYVATNPVQAEIIGSGAPPPTSARPVYAVGVRFLYLNWDIKSMIPLLRNGVPAQHPSGPSVVFKFVNHGDDHADLEIEHLGPVRDDLDHEDSVDCFENLARSLGLPWSIYFPTSARESTHHNDCKAAIVVAK